MKKTGIYCIENIKNGKKYIGSSIDCERRWYIHKWHLNKGKHPNMHLQNAWITYGQNFFNFSILEEVDKSNLLNKEKEYIDLFNTINNLFGYNIANNTLSPMLGRKHSDESKTLMSLVKIGEKNSFFNKKHTEETKEKIRKRKINKKLTEEHRSKVIKSIVHTGEDNINSKLNWQLVEQMRSEIIENKLSVVINKYCKLLNLSNSTIRRAITGKTWKRAENENTIK
jgi:group I intron endonuclease